MSEYFFRRYCNGTRMAEDVRIIQATTLEEACLSASRIAAQYKDGTALVYEPDSELWAHKQLAQDRVLIDALRAELAAEREAHTETALALGRVDAERDALRSKWLKRSIRLASKWREARAERDAAVARAEKAEGLLLDAYNTWGEWPQETLARIAAALLT